MTQYSESPLVFESTAKQLLGILSTPDKTENYGVIIVVGGPQYRVGSHRQFVLLARSLAGHGVPVMRFDYTGMGDSDGELADFEHVEHDIKSAIDVFIEKQPGLKKIILWGLCDAASANLMYAFNDDRVKGLVIANPWVRSEESMAKTFLLHYYKDRFLQKQFWLKLICGDVRIFKSVGSLLANVLSALGIKKKQQQQAETQSSKTVNDPAKADKKDNFITRMRNGMDKFTGPILLIISEKDLTAAEFLDTSSGSRAWRKSMKKADISQHMVLKANHTFSKQIWRMDVEQASFNWLQTHFKD